jgi:hypothetical protein
MHVNELHAAVRRKNKAESRGDARNILVLNGNSIYASPLPHCNFTM